MKAFLLARLTLREAARRRLLLALALLSLGFLLLYALGLHLLWARVQEELREAALRRGPAGAEALTLIPAVLLLLGFYVVNFLGGLAAVLASVGAISGEIDSGTLHAVLPRPIRRWEVLLGKWLGLAALITLYLAGLSGGLLAAVRAITGYFPPQPLPALALLVLEAWLLLALSLLGGTRLSTLANGVVLVMLYGIAWIAGFLEAIGAALGSVPMVNVGIVVSLLVPSDALWRGASYYVQPPALLLAQSLAPGAAIPFASSQPPAPLLVWYSVGYTVLALLLAALSFSSRDL